MLPGFIPDASVGLADEDEDVTASSKQVLELAAMASAGGGFIGVSVAAVKAMSQDDIKNLLDIEYPAENRICNAADVISTCVIDNEDPLFPDAWYAVNDWVEILGNDMKWKLTRVKKVIKQAPADWDFDDPSNKNKEPDWQFYYNVGDATMLREEAIRSPTEGLQRIFGKAPWLWQQYALLKYENCVRFQKDHPHDFQKMQAEEWARKLFYEWVNNPRNAVFSLKWDDVGYTGQKELEGNIFVPFITIDEMTGNTMEEDVWDWDDGNISAFTYLAILGSGATVPVLVFWMQVIIPLLLLESAVGSRETTLWDSLFNSCAGSESESRDWAWRITPSPEEDSEFPQGAYNTLYGKTMAFLVVCFYMFKVVPDTFVSFYNTAGTADTTYSRLMSLRKQVWDQGDDRMLQMMGYKMDLYMNTAFECLLYLFNLFIIFNTNDILDVILNALAIEFVHQLDEDFCCSEWWDPGNRAMKAGAVELVLQSTLLINQLSDPVRIAALYKIDEEEAKAACGDDVNGLFNAALAAENEADFNWMMGDRALERRLGIEATKLKRHDAVVQYCKHNKFFGWEGWILSAFGDNSLAFFEKNKKLRTWSRWDKLLFISPVPENDCWKSVTSEDKDGNEVTCLASEEEMAAIESTVGNSFKNHDLISGTNPMKIFAKDVTETILLVTMFKNVRQCWWNKNYFGMVFRFFEGFLNSAAYTFQCAFPFIVLGALYLVPKCY